MFKNRRLIKMAHQGFVTPLKPITGTIRQRSRLHDEHIDHTQKERSRNQRCIPNWDSILRQSVIGSYLGQKRHAAMSKSLTERIGRICLLEETLESWMRSYFINNRRFAICRSKAILLTVSLGGGPSSLKMSGKDELGSPPHMRFWVGCELESSSNPHSL